MRKARCGDESERLVDILVAVLILDARVHVYGVGSHGFDGVSDVARAKPRATS